MKFGTFALVALMGSAAFAPAHAVVVQTSSGLTTNYFENFEGTSSFSGGVRVNAGLDDYMSLVPNTFLTPNGNTTSFNFTTTADIASLALSFWYSLPTNVSGVVTLASLSQPLDSTGTFGQVFGILGNNPGAGGNVRDSQFNTTLYNLAQGTYTLSFQSNAMKLDDVSISVTAVPEPETYALMLGGLGLVTWVARRRRPRED